MSSSAGLRAAAREIEQYDKYDYVLINDKLEEACENLRAIVLSERLRRLDRPLSDTGEEDHRTGRVLPAGERPGEGEADPVVLRCACSLGTLLGFAVSFIDAT